MAGPQSFPKWLLSCKDDITQTKEWNAFLHELNDAIQQQLTQSHVQYFTDLSDAEKELFMQRATKAIEGGAAFRGMFSKVSMLMDQHVNEDVARQLMEDSPLDTKTDLVIESAEEGVVSLLKKWPEMKSKLHVCLNQPLALPIRQLAWKLFLSNPKVRKTYIDLLNGNPRSAISPLDLEISQKCEQLLISEPTFFDLKGSIGAFYGMKAVLSYHHAIQRTNNRLRDTDYMLVVPFVEVSSPHLSRREPAPGKIVALMVEEFLTFMDTRPGFMQDTGSEAHVEEMRGFGAKVAAILQEHYPEVAKAISDAYLPAREKIVATESGSHALLREGLTELLRPIVRAMFVGYLQMDTLLYVWDQYIIGLDVPGFGTEWLAVVAATMLGLLQDKFKDAKSPAAMENILRRESPVLAIPQFQYQVKRLHYRDLYSMLTADQKAAMPVLDPTQAIHPPWRHWYNDLIPPYTKPQDRRRAREEREAERERILQQKKEAENMRREKEERERKHGEDEYMRAVASERARLERDKMELEQQLLEERRRREEVDRQSQEQIAALRREIEALRYKPKSPAPSTYSVGSYISRVLIPPPPSPASGISQPVQLPPIPESPVRTPSRQATPAEQTEQVILDFLGKIRHSMDKIAHGEGADKQKLDFETEGYIRQNIDDLKDAQAEVFGHRLQPGEFEAMGTQRQQEASDQMMQLMQKWREDRRAQELASQR
ncbi:hypothetical protein BaRGS_00009644 [Batillaria attramentaria]|uniref:Rab-GAP TBC domain-containing protein n=1 Tax=Batillaria attramentaria TaxID=370345 RepID=A0ABD0LHT1_9CAEN